MTIPNDVAIHTDRLVLRPYTLADVDALHDLWTDAEVRRYLWDDEIIPRSMVVDEVEVEMRRWMERGYGQFAVRPADSESLVGFCGFRDFHDPPQLELLVGFHPEVWGSGYAQEAARAVMRFGIEECGFAVIRASTDAPNVASQRRLDRLGLQQVRRVTLKGLDTIFYESSAGEFAGTPGGYRLDRSR